MLSVVLYCLAHIIEDFNEEIQQGECLNVSQEGWGGLGELNGHGLYALLQQMMVALCQKINPYF